MSLRFSSFSSSHKPYGYRANDGYESKNETKGRQGLKKRRIHVFDLWELERSEINASSVTEFRPHSLDSMPLLTFPCPTILVQRVIGLHTFEAIRTDEDSML